LYIGGVMDVRRSLLTLVLLRKNEFLRTPKIQDTNLAALYLGSSVPIVIFQL